MSKKEPKEADDSNIILLEIERLLAAGDDEDFVDYILEMTKKRPNLRQMLLEHLANKS